MKQKSFKHIKKAINDAITGNEDHKSVRELYYWLSGVVLGLKIGSLISKKTYEKLKKYMDFIFLDECYKREYFWSKREKSTRPKESVLAVILSFGDKNEYE